MIRVTPNLSIPALVMLATTLTGCGSDDSPSVTPPTPEKPTPELSNVFGTPDAELAKTGNVYVSIASKINGFKPEYLASRFGCKRYGGTENCNLERKADNFKFMPHPMFPEMMVPVAPEPDDVFNKSDATFDFDYLINRAEVNLKKEGYSQSIRPDVFNDGYASILDILLVTAEKYDLDVEFHYDEEFGTYWIDSINGIKGMDRSWLPSDDELVVPFAKCTGPGGWKAAHGNAKADGKGGYAHSLEEIYHRLDEYYVQSDAAVVFMPACKEEREMRKAIYRAEQKRIDDNGGKVVIPEVVVNFEWDRTAVFKDVEVKAHNQRSDIFKPGVLTHMDLLLSLQEHSKAVEVNFNLWPSLSTGIDVNGFVMNYLTMQGLDDNGELFEYGHQSDAVVGWNYHAGEYERVNDSAFGMLATFKGAFCNIELTGEEGRGAADNQSIRFTLPGSPCTGGDWRPGSGTWQIPMPEDLSPEDITKGPVQMGLVPYSWGDKTPYAPFGTYTYTDKETGQTFEKHRAYYPNGFGGNALHVLPDVVTMHNPEYFELYMNSFFGGSNKFMKKQVDSGQSNTILNYQFESIPPHLVFTAKDIQDAVAPLDESHFGWGVPDCKTCHENGANNGHVAQEMKPFECAACHGSNGAPKGHGEDSTCGFCHASSLKFHGNAYQEVEIAEGEWNPVTDPFASLGRQSKAAEFWGLHTDYPEPASCMTCHPSENHRFIKDK